MALSISPDKKTGGKAIMSFVKDREPVFDEESGTFVCGEKIRVGTTNSVCKRTPIAPRWRCKLHGGDWKPTNKALAVQNGENIYTVKGLWKGYHNIHQNLVQHPELIEQLYSVDLGEELAISRIVVANLLKGDNGELEYADKELQLKALQLVAKIAKTATEIQEKQAHVIKEEFMNGIIAAVIHAFTRANSYSRQSDRARVFVSEFASVLPGNQKLDIPEPEEAPFTEKVIADD